MFRNIMKFSKFLLSDPFFQLGLGGKALPVLQPSFLVISVQLRPTGTILTGSHIVLRIGSE